MNPLNIIFRFLPALAFFYTLTTGSQLLAENILPAKEATSEHSRQCLKTASTSIESTGEKIHAVALNTPNNPSTAPVPSTAPPPAPSTAPAPPTDMTQQPPSPAAAPAPTTRMTQQPGSKEEAYAQVYSLLTQMPKSGAGNLVQLDGIDLMHNFELAPGKDLIMAKISGLYLVVVNAQVGTKPPGARGYVDCWAVKNGKQIPYSNNRQSVESINANSLMNSGALLRLEAGDTMGIVLSASGPSLGIISNSDFNEPPMTSIDFLIYKID